MIEQLIDNLRDVLDTLSKDGDEFSGAIDRLDQLIKGLSADRDPIGTAIESLDNGTTSLADLLGRARQPLAGTIDSLNRLAPLLDKDNDRAWTPPSSACPRSTASSLGSAPTARSSRTTSAGSPSAPATFRAAPCCSRGSSRKREGAWTARC